MFYGAHKAEESIDFDEQHCSARIVRVTLIGYRSFELNLNVTSFIRTKCNCNKSSCLKKVVYH